VFFRVSLFIFLLFDALFLYVIQSSGLVSWFSLMVNSILTISSASLLHVYWVA